MGNGRFRFLFGVGEEVVGKTAVLPGNPLFLPIIPFLLQFLYKQFGKITSILLRFW